jgi:hypothetical protein
MGGFGCCFAWVYRCLCWLSRERQPTICGTELRTDCVSWNADGLCGGGWTRGLSGAARCEARQFARCGVTLDRCALRAARCALRAARCALLAAEARAERLALTRRWARACGHRGLLVEARGEQPVAGEHQLPGAGGRRRPRTAPVRRSARCRRSCAAGRGGPSPRRRLNLVGPRGPPASCAPRERREALVAIIKNGVRGSPRASSPRIDAVVRGTTKA